MAGKLIDDLCRALLKELKTLTGQIFFVNPSTGERGARPDFHIRDDDGLYVRLVAGEFRSDSYEGLLLRARENPEQLYTGLAYISGAHIYLHPGSGEGLGADGWCHLGVSETAESWPRGSKGYIYAQSGIQFERYTLAQLPPDPASRTIIFIVDSVSDTPGDVIVGGGSYWVFAAFNGTDWIVMFSLGEAVV